MIDPAELSAVHQGLRHLLDPRRTSAWEVQLPADRFTLVAERHRLHGFLALHRDRVVLPAGAEEDFAATVRTERLSSLVQIRETLRVIDVLRAAGVPALTLKGPALAVQVYDDQAARGPGDIDLLVAPDRVEDAYRALYAAGWLGDARMPLPGPTSGWRYVKRIHYELTLLRGPLGVDLHWHLGPTRHGLPTFAEVWQRRVEVELAGVAVATLAPTDAFVHTCHHATKERWQTLRGLLDARVLAERADLLPAQPTRPTRLTLGLVERQLGLPAAAARLAHGSDHVERVAVEHQLLDGDPVPRFPGARIPSNLATRLRESHHPADLARISAYLLITVEDGGTGTLGGILRHRARRLWSLLLRTLTGRGGPVTPR